MSAHILLVLAAICFGLDALRVQTPINLTALGLLFVTFALWL